MNLVYWLLLFAIGAYAIAFILFASEFLNVIEKRVIWAARFVELGFLIHTLLIFAETFSVSRSVTNEFHLPVTTLGEASGFFAWSLAFVYLILLRQMRTETFGVILTPVLILFLIPVFFPFHPNEELFKHFHDGYFLIHILSAFFGYASFALSFIAALFYLVLNRALKEKTSSTFYHRLPPLEDLERLAFRTIQWGVILLGFAILSGALWAKTAFGSFILKEPKSFASFLTWAVYLVIIYLHEVLQIKGKRIVLMSLGAFVLVLFTFLGTSLFHTGLHAGVR
ncbi:MAG: cytochrome c biogenesis protein CcsA [Candidatus Omnitrophica bacterium]|nr:cytochrome c biogenesis protein CcsA [Candidatus Omnitrophota bacterium]